MPSVSYSASSSPEVDDSFVMKRVVWMGFYLRMEQATSAYRFLIYKKM